MHGTALATPTTPIDTMADTDLTASLADVKVPTLVLCGAEDTVTGVTAGVAAGATVLGFAPSGTTGHSAAQALLAAGAVHVLQQLHELPDWCLKNHQKA